MSVNKQGWASPINTRKYHYFDENNMSLCHRYFIFGTVIKDDTMDDHPDNCKACSKIRARQKAKQA